jgi:hypothetical protein
MVLSDSEGRLLHSCRQRREWEYKWCS